MRPNRQRAALDGVVVSIHAPTQGATFTLSPNFDKPVKLNPRTHAGCDAQRTRAARSRVSIHAPTQGAPPDSARACTRGCFNPRTHAGCDWRHSLCLALGFQSTHPRRVRRGYLRDKRPKLVFQSTHPRRVRPSATTDDVVVFQVFNPRTHAGCDRTVQQRLGRQDMFNPRTHAGCDR